jgi:hypothetical protein
VAWQIRDIPESIRDAVVEQARLEKVNVAELVTRLVLEARAAGWSVNAANRFANASNELRVCAARSRRRSPVGRTRWYWVLVEWSGTVGT